MSCWGHVEDRMWKHRGWLNFSLKIEMVSTLEGVCRLERVPSPTRKNCKSQSFCPKSPLTCAIPSESFLIKGGWRKTHSTPALMSSLTQNKNRGPWGLSFTADNNCKTGRRTQMTNWRRYKLLKHSANVLIVMTDLLFPFLLPRYEPLTNVSFNLIHLDSTLYLEAGL